MTVPSATNKVSYAGNDSTTIFSFSFKIFLNTDITVTIRDSAGNETVQVLNTDYTVTGVGDDAGGSITYPVTGDPLPTGSSIFIERILTQTQDTNLRNQGDWNPEVVEDELDRSRMIDQQEQTEIDRTVKFKTTTDRSGNTNEIPDAEDGKVLGWNSTGDLVNLNGQTLSSVTVPVVANATALTAVDDTVNDIAFMEGKTTAGDKWYGWFKLFTGSTETVDGQDVIATNSGTGRWHRQNYGENTIYTAVAGGTADAITVSTAPIANVTNEPTRLFVIENTAGQCTVTNPTIKINTQATLTLKDATSGALVVGATGNIGYKMLVAVNNATNAAILLNPYIPSSKTVKTASLDDQAVGKGQMSWLPFASWDGLNITNHTDANHDILISAGNISDSTQSYIMELGSSFIKAIDATFAVGSGAGVGGFSDQSTLNNNQWYRVYLISKSTDPTDCDVIIASSSSDALGDTVAAAAGFDISKRIGYVRTDGSSNIVPWSKMDGNFYLWDVMNDENATISTSGESLTVRVPDSQTGLFVYTIVSSVDPNMYGLLTRTSQTNTAPSSSVYHLQVDADVADAGAQYNSCVVQLKVSSGRAIRHRESDGIPASCDVFTLGFYDNLSVDEN